MPDPREPLGRLVRETWTAWAREQPHPWKASHLTGWDDLDDGSREVDMRIGAAIAAVELERLRETAEREKGELVLHGRLVDAVPWSLLIGMLDEIANLDVTVDDATPDVHVDWHMTPAEWAQLREALRSRKGLPYIDRLWNEGKLNA